MLALRVDLHARVNEPTEWLHEAEVKCVRLQRGILRGNLRSGCT